MRSRTQLRLVLPAALWMAMAHPALRAQNNAPPPSQTTQRTRLILKDGSYQAVKGYQIKGTLVVYTSAARNEVEEVATDLVDWPATHAWERQHSSGSTPQASGQTSSTPERTVISPELAREEANRANRTPQVAPNLRLPESGSVFALDTFHDTPELVLLPQTGGDLSPLNSHSVVKLPLNPQASPHPVITLKHESAAYPMHVSKPIFYMRIGKDTGLSSGAATFTVDTHGAGGAQDDPDGGSAQSRYVILRSDVRVGARMLNSFSIGLLSNRPQRDVMETTTALLPGSFWMAITPKEPLEPGEYALVEVLDDRTINSAVWEFGVHPQSPDNRDAIKPEQPRAPSLGRRP